MNNEGALKANRKHPLQSINESFPLRLELGLVLELGIGNRVGVRVGDRVSVGVRLEFMNNEGDLKANRTFPLHHSIPLRLGLGLGLVLGIGLGLGWGFDL
jgi:hypothetical protein